MPVLYIAAYTFKGYLRERVPLVVLVFALLLLISSYVLSPLAVGAQVKIVVDVGLASLSIFGVLLIVLLCAGSHYREKERGVLATLLSKPISRVDFLLGKYLGTYAVVAMVMVLMAAVFVGLLGFGGVHVGQKVIWAIYLSLLEVAMIAAVMILFSTFTTPFLSSFLTLCVFVSGRLSKDILAFASKFGGKVLRGVAEGTYYLLPNLSLFNLRQEAVHGLSVPDGFVSSVTLYAVFYTAVLLWISAAIFRWRDVA